MNKCIVVTEGKIDIAILKAILNPAEDDNVEFFPAGGWSSADSYARSVLINGMRNVALVVGADTTDANLVEERRSFLHRSMGAIAFSQKWKVVALKPKIEMLLFKDRKVIEALAGRPLSETDFVRACFTPKEVIKELFADKNLADVYETDLPKLNLNQIREATPIQELMTFLKLNRTSATQGKKSMVAT